MEKTVEIGMLFDYYGKMLTEKQQKIFRLYYYHDLSLGEISEKIDISRQGVYDHLHRGEKILRDYEDKMNLIKKYRSFQDKLEEIIDYINNESEIAVSEKRKLCDQIDELKQYL